MFKKLRLIDVLAGIAILGIVASCVLPRVTCTIGIPRMVFSNETAEPYTFIYYEEKTQKELYSIDVKPFEYRTVRIDEMPTIDWRTYPVGVTCVVQNLKNPIQGVYTYPIEDEFHMIFRITNSGPILGSRKRGA